MKRNEYTTVVLVLNFLTLNGRVYTCSFAFDLGWKEGKRHSV